MFVGKILRTKISSTEAHATLFTFHMCVHVPYFKQDSRYGTQYNFMVYLTILTFFFNLGLNNWGKFYCKVFHNYCVS